MKRHGKYFPTYCYKTLIYLISALKNEKIEGQNEYNI